MCSQNRMGSSERMALFSKPFASQGVVGLMTVRPGACMNRLSTQLECSAPAPKEEPMAQRMTSGSR